jgi:hypothetical protein
MYDDGAPGDDDAGEILYLVDQLEELVGVGKRVPFSGKVMVEEEIFLGLIDQLRVAVPNEIKQAQRVIRERERIIAEAQEEASKILETAKKRVAYLISKEGILNEARQQGEEILRQADDTRKRTLGEIDVFAIEQFDYVEQALRKSLSVMDEAVRHTVSVLDQARDSVGK